MLGAIEGFRGTKRFILEGQLGEGGMGVVHRARDVERGEIVALKTMSRLDPASLLRFKNEFRALADIVHDNVVQLYELFSEGDQWFFTMELVDGCDLISWVHSSLSMPPPPPRETRMAADAMVSGVQATLLAPTELIEVLAASSGSMPAAPAATLPPRVRFFVRDVDRLRAAFRQLAAGVAMIHARGKLHRDLKPSNVIVSRSGRVVILDFGVVGEYRPGEPGQRGDETLVGTPAYMAPEQAAFQPASPASDWYAVGVMMFEALTQRMPFEGSTTELLLAKQRPLGARPRDLVEGIPEDLEQLCVDLLQVDPRSRPPAEDILRRLEGERTPAISASVEIPFVGRRAQLDALHAAFDASHEGPPVAVMLHGRSGMGKSALAARFLGQLEARPDTLVLSGRCYDREAVPFKAVDQVVDELSRWLARLPEEEAYALLPPEIHALARLFPVIKNARVVTMAPADSDAGAVDPLEVRRRAFSALKQLLAAIAARWSLVVHIDDLQWGDADSVQLLEAVLSPPAPRPMLLVCGHRSESAASSEALALLRRTLASLGGACKVREVEVGALSDREARELARALVDSSDPAVPAAIAAEAQGSPLFVAELGRWANERGGAVARGGGGTIALDEMIAARVAELPEDARALLEAVSVAGGPVAHGIVEAASGTAGKRRPAALALRAAHFVSTRGLRDDDLVETSHDRIRETVVAAMDEASRRARHLALARAYAGSSRTDPEAAFAHFRAGGDDASARDYALRAAESADQGLAFLRAARLYRAAIELGAERPDQLYAHLGDALANAGRGAEAADAYMEAAARSSGREALNLRRVAAEHLLKAGRDDRGLAALQQVLSAVGVRYPESTQAAVASLLWHEARLRVARLTRTLRRPQSLSPRLLDQFDAAFAAATGLTTSDLLRSADFANRALLLALEAGEPVRLGRALAVAAGNVAARGESARRRADALVRAAQQVADQVDDPHGRALALLAGGFVHFFLGEWRGARAKLEEAETILRTRCRAVAWELANTQAWTCNVLILSGELREASRRVPAIVEEARSRDDSFALMHLTYPACCAHIVADDVHAAWRVTELAATHAGGDGAFTSFHWGAFISGCSVERYRGDGRAAWERVKRTSPALDGSSLSRIALVRTFSAYERGLSAIAAAAAGHDRTVALDAADDWARRLSRESVSFAPAMGQLLRAGLFAARGDRKRADSALELAIPALDAADLGYLAACARHRRGELLAGSAGAELVARSRAFFAAQGIVNPERCLQMSAPGFS
ncbi:MAG TPA: protein kinase [Polyangiaceae bacterium]